MLHYKSREQKAAKQGGFIPSIFLCFSSCIFLCAVSCSCIPVANSSCKFYFHWGKHSQAQKLSNQILIRCQVSINDELANASPNGNRICNWNLQLECNCRKLHTRICNWKNTRSGSPCEHGSVPLQQNCSLMKALHCAGTGSKDMCAQCRVHPLRRRLMTRQRLSLPGQIGRQKKMDLRGAWCF